MTEKYAFSQNQNAALFARRFDCYAPTPTVQTEAETVQVAPSKFPRGTRQRLLSAAAIKP